VICSRCGMEHSNIGFKRCSACREYMRKYKAPYRARRVLDRQPGSCTRADCGRPVEDPSFKLCTRCRQSERDRIEKDPTHNLKTRTNNLRLKRIVVEHYGGSCACCAVEFVEFLTVDHILGDGQHHLLPCGSRYVGTALYRWLIRNNFPPGFRVLCISCNMALGHHGYCPHSNLKQEVHLGRPRVCTPHPNQEGRARKRRSYWIDNYKLPAMLAYGGVVCNCCGENHLECLNIDHIKGGGRAHRRKTGTVLYIWLKQNNYPPGFRVLCTNCNFARGRYGYCPHERRNGTLNRKPGGIRSGAET